METMEAVRLFASRLAGAPAHLALMGSPYIDCTFGRDLEEDQSGETTITRTPYTAQVILCMIDPHSNPRSE